MEKPLTGYLTRSLIARIAPLISEGGVAVLPTDTIYGFHCSASRPEAIELIRKLKGRGDRSCFIVLASDIDMADSLIERWPGGSRKILEQIWPAPLTAILPASGTIPQILAPRGTLAVRVPDFKELRELIKKAGAPLVSTSVNVSGKKPLTRIGEIRKSFAGLAAYASRRGRSRQSPSTVVDFTADPARILRAGAYRWRL